MHFTGFLYWSSHFAKTQLINTQMHDPPTALAWCQLAFCTCLYKSSDATTTPSHIVSNLRLLSNTLVCFLGYLSKKVTNFKVGSHTLLSSFHLLYSILKLFQRWLTFFIILPLFIGYWSVQRINVDLDTKLILCTKVHYKVKSIGWMPGLKLVSFCTIQAQKARSYWMSGSYAVANITAVINVFP